MRWVLIVLLLASPSLGQWGQSPWGLDSWGSGEWGTDAFSDPFSPLDLAPLFMVWRSPKNTITVTGSGVSTWADQGSVGADATQGTDAQRPAYDGSVVTFDGDDDNMTLGTILAGADLQLNGVTATIIAFVVPTDGGTRDDFARIVDKSSGNNGADGYTFGIRNTAGSGALFVGIGGAADISTTVVADDVLSMVGVRVVTTTASFIYNGAYMDDATVIAIPNSAQTLKIGERAYTTASNIDGQIKGIMIYNTALTAADLVQIYNWGMVN